MKSLTQELMSTKHRVRDFIDTEHWLTDGEWKESVLRQALRRNLPTTVQVGRGFIICSDRPSKQIDVLIYRNDYPVLFRDGDLVFLSPDAVLGIIEVKSALNNSQARCAIDKLAEQVRTVRGNGRHQIFSGLFSYDSTAGDREILEAAKRAAQNDSNVALAFASLGEDSFYRFWTEDPTQPNVPVRKWHSYNMPSLAPGYFLHNIVDRTSPESVQNNKHLWYPEQSKELRKTDEENLG